MCVCTCVCVLTHLGTPISQPTTDSPFHPLLPFQVVGLVLLACGIYMFSQLNYPDLSDLDRLMIVLEGILFTVGAILAFVFSAYGIVAAITQSRTLLVIVSCMHVCVCVCVCVCARACIDV